MQKLEPEKARTYQGSPCKRGHAGVRRVNGHDCVECNKERARERWNREPGYKDKWLAQRRAKYATEGGRAYRREHNLLKNYGLTISDYEMLLVQQSNCCACCMGHTSKVGNLVVDHCHATDEVRELLCNNCNRALGGLLDSPMIAERAAAYLRKHGRT